jgi:hypothetical protein
LYNKPKAEVHLGYKVTGPEEEEEEDRYVQQGLPVIKYEESCDML